MTNQTPIPAPVAQAIDALLQTIGTDLTTLLEEAKEGKNGQLLMVKEVAKRLNVSIPTVYRLIKSGTLKPVYLGQACTRIPESQLIEIARGEENAN